MNSPGDQHSLNEDAIEAMAAAWLVERDAGFTREQADEFARWCSADPRHAAAIAMMEETAGLLEKLPQVQADPVLRETLAPATPATARRGRVIAFPRLLKAAVALAACVALGFVLWSLRGDRTEFASSYATTAGGYLRVPLPDQSVIELNGETEVHVRYVRTGRHITLAQGEAFFSVAKNPARPFEVRAGKVGVRALGTAFSVRRSAQQIEVLVTEGRVQVSGDASAATELPVLTAGQRVIVPMGALARDGLVANVDAGAMRTALAWQQRLEFSETPLAEVVEQFNRHNRVQLIVSDSELSARRVGGAFRADNVEAFVRLLENSGDIAVERPSADKIVLRRAKP